MYDCIVENSLRKFNFELKKNINLNEEKYLPVYKIEKYFP